MNISTTKFANIFSIFGKELQNIFHFCFQKQQYE